MNIKSTTYMQSSEFKERQGSFAFFCAQAFEYLVNFKNEALKGWINVFRSPVGRFENITLALPFAAPLKHSAWMRMAKQLELNLAHAG
ncbi:MAG: hypothetical protein PHI29_13330 [Gallionella sp.]|nr:hypothetical protein [Gallionella sp.]